ncbi:MULTISPECIES: hypothetical protein [Ramlibacter]|uniref:Uncharacterized protein n=1 Tax=Ramlibacter aquaticus TaxID=2780094 RepID=A0ABR9SEP7_9BURK|nr:MULTISPECIES: hypothetical protein [Ramlibacter]MBE7940825.1 hypothetical protein [Ramlibacter aquaticus]
MPNQEESRDGVPRKSPDRPSPDVSRDATDGQSDARGRGASDTQGEPVPTPGEADDRARGYPGDGPAKVGLTSSRQPGLVAPSGVNERDHGAADDKPMGGGSVNLDDGTSMEHPRGRTGGQGGTWQSGSDSAPLGPPGAGLSDSNGPSDPDRRGGPRQE